MLRGSIKLISRLVQANAFLGDNIGTGHDHHHQAPTNFNRAFAIGIILNLVFVLIEAFFGFYSQSLALLADAGHNLSDVGGLALAWGASYLTSLRPTQRFTYGLRRSSIMAALFNAVILLVAVGAIAIESFYRINRQTEPQSLVMIWVAAIGIIINTVTALLFLKGRHQDINIKGAYLHMVADAAISAGVVITGILIMLTGWNWLDAIISLVIASVIALSSWRLLSESFRLALDAVPDFIDTEEVKKFLLSLPGVVKLHDLHIWAMSTSEVALTVHVVRPKHEGVDQFLHEVAHQLETKFKINHVTIQIEQGEGRHICHQEPDEVV